MKTPQTDSLIYPTTAKDPVTGEPVEVINVNDVRHMELTHKTIVANLLAERDEMERTAMECVAMNERQARNFAKCQAERAELVRVIERCQAALRANGAPNCEAMKESAEALRKLGAE